MRTVKHRFPTLAEANAFRMGVDWVNDGAITLERFDETPEGFVLTFSDEDHDESLLMDYPVGYDPDYNPSATAIPNEFEDEDEDETQ